MVNIVNDLAVQTFCFRNAKENTEVIQRVKACDLAAVEICQLHTDFDNESSFDEVISLYRDSGIAIVSIGVEKITDDEAALRKRFKFARKAGIRVFSIAFPPDATDVNYRLAERLSNEYDIRLAMHNHGSRHWQGSTEAIRRLFTATTPQIGLCLDTAWALDARDDPVAMAEEFAHRLYMVHLKDFVFDRSAAPRDVVVGEGNLDLQRFMATLNQIDFNGPAILEFEGEPENPLPELIKCVEAIRRRASTGPLGP